MTQINKNISKFKHTRYMITASIIPKNSQDEKESIVLDEAISELLIFKHYDAQSFPYFKLTVSVSKMIAERISASWRDSTLFITMTRFIAEQKDGVGAVFEKEDSRYLEKIEFRIMTCNGTEPQRIENGDEISATIPSITFIMELAPKKAFDINKGINNGTFQNTKVIDVIAFITQNNAPESGYKFLLAPSDNQRVYESLLLPPKNYVPAIRHLDVAHGLYGGTLTVFLDVDIGYILSSTKTTIENDKSPTTVVLEVLPANEASADNSGIGSAFDPETRAFTIRSFQPITARIDGLARREVAGEHIKLVQLSNEERLGSDCKYLSVDEKGSDIKKEAVVWQKYDNSLAAEKMRVKAREDYAPQVLTFMNCDLKIFAPNLQWILLTSVESSEKFEGAWRCQSFEARLNKPVGTVSSFSVSVNAMIVPTTSTTSKT